MSIYISGPITGQLDYGKRFGEAAARLTAAGHTIYNPAAEPLRNGKNDYTDYMRRDLEVILTRATGLALLPGWENSDGAFTEWRVAKSIGLPTRSVEAWEKIPAASTDPEGQALVAAIIERKTKPKQPSTHITLDADGTITKNVPQKPCEECDQGWTTLSTGEPFPCANCDAPPPLRLAHRDKPATRYTPVTVVPLTPEEEQDDTPVPTWPAKTADRCVHQWTRVDTLPPIKECAGCGETRIIHA